MASSFGLALPLGISAEVAAVAIIGYGVGVCTDECKDIVHPYIYGRRGRRRRRGLVDYTQWNKSE